MEPFDACMFLWQENKTERQKIEKSEKKQKDAMFSSCFHCLVYFINFVENMFLKLHSMFNTFQLEFLQLEFIC